MQRENKDYESERERQRKRGRFGDKKEEENRKEETFKKVAMVRCSTTTMTGVRKR